MSGYYTMYRVNTEVIMNIYSEVIKDLLYQAIDDSIRFTPFWNRHAGTLIYDSADGQGGIEWVISTDNMRAFVDEYGSGQYIDDKNPYYEEYKHNSIYWNPWREDKKIVTRQYGQYPGFDWETGTPEEKMSFSMVPGVRTTFRGLMPRPKVDSILKDIETAFLSLIETEGQSRIDSAINREFDSIFVQEIHRI